MRGGLSGKLHGRSPSQMVSHCSSHRSDSQIFVENRDFCLHLLHSMPPFGGPRRNIAITFRIEKLEWCEKIIRFDRIYKRDRQTDRHGRTPHDSLGRACIASRGKNLTVEDELRRLYVI